MVVGRRRSFGERENKKDGLVTDIYEEPAMGMPNVWCMTVNNILCVRLGCAFGSSEDLSCAAAVVLLFAEASLVVKAPQGRFEFRCFIFYRVTRVARYAPSLQLDLIAPPPEVGHKTFRMGTRSLAVRSSTEPTSSNHGPITDTELEEPARSDTDTELDEPAPAFHAPDAEVAETDRRRRRNSNGGPVAPLTRSRAKKIKRLSDHLFPAMSHRLAMRDLHDHNDPA
ncbi:unnamed protein product [Pylaiella littoralis]